MLCVRVPLWRRPGKSEGGQEAQDKRKEEHDPNVDGKDLTMVWDPKLYSTASWGYPVLQNFCGGRFGLLQVGILPISLSRFLRRHRDCDAQYSTASANLRRVPALAFTVNSPLTMATLIGPIEMPVVGVEFQPQNTTCHGSDGYGGTILPSRKRVKNPGPSISVT